MTTVECSCSYPRLSGLYLPDVVVLLRSRMQFSFPELRSDRARERGWTEGVSMSVRLQLVREPVYSCRLRRKRHRGRRMLVWLEGGLHFESDLRDCDHHLGCGRRGGTVRDHHLHRGHLFEGI